MRRLGLVLTYHAVADGPAPVCISPALFERHVAEIAAAGVPALTVGEVGDALRAGSLPDRFVALTFDDGFADTVEVALPLLAAAGLRATVFAVSGHVGGTSDWPSQPAGVPRRALADESGLRRLVDAGWEVGAHGIDHAPLDLVAPDEVARQLGGSREALERALGVEVRSFAYPYGALPANDRSAVAQAGYGCACTTALGGVSPDSDRLRLPRVDAHYLRRPRLLALALAGRAGPYLALRRAGRRARSVLVGGGPSR